MSELQLHHHSLKLQVQIFQIVEQAQHVPAEGANVGFTIGKGPA